MYGMKEERKRKEKGECGEKRQMPVQRKVGLEFQTYKGKWNIKKLRSGRDMAERERIVDKLFASAGRSEEPKRAGELLVSAERVTLAKRRGYEITTDGTDLEYVTNAFDEADEIRLAAMIKAAGDAGNSHQELLDNPPDYADAKVGVDYYKVRRGGECYYINRLGEQTAHPQATVGVALEKIPELIHRIVRAGKGNLLYQDVPTAGVSRRQLREIEGGVDWSLAHAQGIQEPDKCKAFIELVEESIRAASHNQKAENAMRGFIGAVNDRVSKADALTAFTGGGDLLEEAFAPNIERARLLVQMAHFFFGDGKMAELLLLKTQEIGQKREEINAAWSLLRQQREILPGEDFAERREALREAARELIADWERVRQTGNRWVGEMQALAKEVRIACVPELVRGNKDEYTYLHTAYLWLKDYAVRHPLIFRDKNIRDWYGMLESPGVIQKYFKTLLSVKSRTSFFDLFLLLQPMDRRYVWNYLSCYPDDALIERDKEGKVTLGEWRKGMLERRTDILNYELENESSDAYKQRCMRRFHVTRSTQIDRQKDGEDVEGAILELRKLKDKVLPNKWSVVAREVGMLMNTIHGAEYTAVPHHTPAAGTTTAGATPAAVPGRIGRRQRRNSF
ncbi:MAG: hypothetical protein NC180_09400 [Muribaculaceae bacterium]|nr:hypothetical protein [Roseburia sp.]MCM1431863.1 hypothetical protein [Muribaculaceae bacterium]MCM1493423.1 hypothetical protein [Muribaculaceae bacterium]